MTTALNQELEAIAAILRRSTVQVRGRQLGAGSGVIWRPDGLIITNAHVIRGSRATVELADGQTYEAAVVRRDDRRDLAALSINATGLPGAAIGNSDALRVGQLVFAVGNPLGQVGALTMGIIHALPVSSQDWLQADIRLAPGNSGGALADAQGRIIGINTMIVNGLGFAIPSQAIARFLQPQDRPYLGVTLQPVLQRVGGPLGLLVLEVAIGSPAASQLLIGDVLTGVNGQAFARIDALSASLDRLNPGDTVQLELVRSGQRLTCAIVLDRQANEVRAA